MRGGLPVGPGYYDKVIRAARVRVRAQDAHGEPFELEAEGLLAVCIQHEMDHLRARCSSTTCRR